MEYLHNKPKLVFFLYRYDASLPEFLLIHKREHVKCLRQFFDVTTIDYDCDYRQICDQYQPDLALFESAFNVSFSYCQRPRIINTGACPTVPKLGFLHSDSFSEGRAGFLSDMDQWGIETFFSIATTAAEHVPGIADNLFIWPNFIDAEIYHDYRESKNIPVLLTGSTNVIYPWRRKISELVGKRYPSLICPHPGFNPAEAAMQVMVGQRYARLLNASWFVPACGSVAKEVVRKHFEAPGCKACLVTERSQALEAAGFVDMTNCVFADESDILDKLDYLFRNADMLKDLIDAGYRLVHGHHTLKNRDQIFQWFNLQRNVKPNERIVQTSPFGPLRIVGTSQGLTNSHVVSGGLDLELLRQGDEKLWKGNHAEAESFYLKCLSLVPWMPEPQLRLALCNLYKGNAKRALSWISQPVKFTLFHYKAVDPDPVEWAYFIITLLCLGKVKRATRCAAQFLWLHHPELDRVRLVTGAIGMDDSTISWNKQASARERISIHRLPDRDMAEWIRHICSMLVACGQSQLARRLRRRVTRGTLFSKTIRKDERATNSWNVDRERQKVEISHLVSDEKRARRYPTAWAILKRVLRYVLHGLERKYGIFLPYRLSHRKNNKFSQAVEDLAEREGINAVLIIGASLMEEATAALLAGARRNRNKPFVNCVTTSRNPLFRKRFWNKGSVRWYGFSHASPEHVPKELEKVMSKIKKETETSIFDLLLIDGSKLKNQTRVSGVVKKEIAAASFVILDDVNEAYNHENYDTLLRDPNYVLMDHNFDLRNGYAIFKKQLCGKLEGPAGLPATFILSE
jgi:hypothetical protein